MNGTQANGTVKEEPKTFIAVNRAARNVPTDNEEAGAILNLGEFEGVQTLSVSEARVIMDAVFDQRRKKGNAFLETDAILKMQDHMDTFARFKDRGVMADLESLLKGSKLENFEKSQLTTLCPGDSEEAKTLIPSLQDKISDEDLQEILEEINERRRVY